MYFSLGGNGYDIFIKKIGRESLCYMNIENSQKMQKMACEDEQSNDSGVRGEDEGEVDGELPIDDTWKNDTAAGINEIIEDNLNPLITGSVSDKELNNQGNGVDNLMEDDVSHGQEKSVTKSLQDERKTEDFLQELVHNSGKELILGQVHNVMG